MLLVLVANGYQGPHLQGRKKAIHSRIRCHLLWHYPVTHSHLPILKLEEICYFFSLVILLTAQPEFQTRFEEKNLAEYCI